MILHESAGFLQLQLLEERNNSDGTKMVAVNVTEIMETKRNFLE